MQLTLVSDKDGFRAPVGLDLTILDLTNEMHRDCAIGSIRAVARQCRDRDMRLYVQTDDNQVFPVGSLRIGDMPNHALVTLLVGAIAQARAAKPAIEPGTVQIYELRMTFDGGEPTDMDLAFYPFLASSDQDAVDQVDACLLGLSLDRKMMCSRYHLLAVTLLPRKPIGTNNRRERIVIRRRLLSQSPLVYGPDIP